MKKFNNPKIVKIRLVEDGELQILYVDTEDEKVNIGYFEKNNLKKLVPISYDLYPILLQKSKDSSDIIKHYIKEIIDASTRIIELPEDIKNITITRKFCDCNKPIEIDDIKYECIVPGIRYSLSFTETLEFYKTEDDFKTDIYVAEIADDIGLTYEYHALLSNSDMEKVENLLKNKVGDAKMLLNLFKRNTSETIEIIPYEIQKIKDVNVNWPKFLSWLINKNPNTSKEKTLEK